MSVVPIHMLLASNTLACGDATPFAMPSWVRAAVAAVVLSAFTTRIRAAQELPHQTGFEPPKKPDHEVFVGRVHAEKQIRLLKRANSDDNAQAVGKRRNRSEGSEESGPPQQRQRTQQNGRSMLGAPGLSPSLGAPTQPEARPSPMLSSAPYPQHGPDAAVEGGERLSLLRQIHHGATPKSARNEIALRTVIARRLDLYLSQPTTLSRPHHQDVLEERKKRFERQPWPPNADIKHHIQIAYVYAVAGARQALELFEHYQKHWRVGIHADRVTEVLCSGIHAGFHRYLATLHPSASVRLLAEATNTEYGTVGLTEMIRPEVDTPHVSAGSRDSRDWHSILRKLEGPIHDFVSGSFKYANWLSMKPHHEAVASAHVRHRLETETWQLIRSLQKHRNYLGPQLLQLRRRAHDAAHVWHGHASWEAQMQLFAVLTAVDFAVAAFPRHCRHFGFQRETIPRGGMAMPPPLNMPAWLIDPADQRHERLLDEHRGQVEPLQHLRPLAKPQRMPPSSELPYPNGVPKEELQGGSRRRIEHMSSW